MVLAAHVVGAAERGYAPRACGFDLNFNGTGGEPRDCSVCNGTSRDVDANGVQDLLFYIEAASGADTLGCGPPASPCKTVSYVLSERLSTPAARQIQAICLKGTFTEALNIGSVGIDGAPGIYTRPAGGNQVRAFQYPRYPLILTAWDTDADGVYSDETAVINASDHNTQLFVENTDRLEIAHLHFTGGNASCRIGVAFIDTTPGQHQYFHDLVVENYARGCDQWIGIEIFGGGDLEHFAVENVNFDEVGGAFWWRGSPTGGPFRWQRNTVKVYGASGGTVEGVKIWELNQGFEILDSIWDSNVASWGGNTRYGWGRGLTIAQCSRDWDIVNNELRDWETSIVLQPSASFACSSRSIDDITIDRNIIRSSVKEIGVCHKNVGILMQSGQFADTFVEDLTITNNFLSHSLSDEWQAAILVDAGHKQGPCADLPGAVVIVNNTVDVDVTPTGCAFAGVVRIANLGATDCRQQDYIFRNNIVGGISPDDMLLYVDFAPLRFRSDYNVFDGNRWVWNGRSHTLLSSWRSELGGSCPGAADSDCHSRLCTPLYQRLEDGDFHLHTDDRCALQSGTSQSPAVEQDIDGDRRPQGHRWEIGADEAVSPSLHLPAEGSTPVLSGPEPTPPLP